MNTHRYVKAEQKKIIKGYMQIGKAYTMCGV